MKTIGELKHFIEHLPDDLEVGIFGYDGILECEGWYVTKFITVVGVGSKELLIIKIKETPEDALW